MAFIRNHTRLLVAGLVASAIALAALVVPASLSAGPGANSRTGSPSAQLTTEQRQCLTDQGLQRPTTRPTAAQRNAFRAAAAGCGITLRAKRADRAGAARRLGALTSTQRDCLTEQGITRPAAGTRPTADRRQAFRDAAQACGIRLPGWAGQTK